MAGLSPVFLLVHLEVVGSEARVRAAREVALVRTQLVVDARDVLAQLRR